MMIFVILTILVVILFILYCVLNVSSHPQQPAISCADKDFLDVILKTAPLLEKP